MRPRFAGRTTAPRSHLAPALMIAAGLLAAALAAPALQTLRAKEAARAADRTVGLAVDLDDIRAFVPAADRSAFYSSILDVPVTVMAVRDDIAKDDESALRSA